MKTTLLLTIVILFIFFTNIIILGETTFGPNQPELLRYAYKAPGYPILVS